MTFVNAVQKANAPRGPPLVGTPSPRLVTVLGMVRLVRLVHHAKVPNQAVSRPPLMVVIPLPIVRVVRFVQPRNAAFPRLVTVSGMVTPVRLVELENAASPTLVTGKPLRVAGITTFPPGPI